MRLVLCCRLIDAGVPSGNTALRKNTQLVHVWYVEVTSPANSWNTLADTNGCRKVSPAVNDVPTRMVARPISLSMSSIFTVPEKSRPPGRPTALNASTFVRDQVKPTEGSTNQPLPNWKLYPADALTDAPCALNGWLKKLMAGLSSSML